MVRSDHRMVNLKPLPAAIPESRRSRSELQVTKEIIVLESQVDKLTEILQLLSESVSRDYFPTLRPVQPEAAHTKFAGPAFTSRQGRPLAKDDGQPQTLAVNSAISGEPSHLSTSGYPQDNFQSIAEAQPAANPSLVGHSRKHCDASNEHEASADDKLPASMGSMAEKKKVASPAVRVLVVQPFSAHMGPGPENPPVKRAALDESQDWELKAMRQRVEVLQSALASTLCELNPTRSRLHDAASQIQHMSRLLSKKQCRSGGNKVLLMVATLRVKAQSMAELYSHSFQELAETMQQLEPLFEGLQHLKDFQEGRVALRSSIERARDCSHLRQRLDDHCLELGMLTHHISRYLQPFKKAKASRRKAGSELFDGEVKASRLHPDFCWDDLGSDDFEMREKSHCDVPDFDFGVRREA